MVPEEWQRGKVEDLIARLDSGVSVNGEDRDMREGEIGVLKVSAVSYGAFSPSQYKTVTKEEARRARVTPKKGQIIISRSNTEALVGASAYIEADWPSLFLPDKLWQTVPRPAVEFDMKWLAYLLSASHARYRLSQLATGTSGSMKNITKDELLSLDIEIPPTNEQQKIARILSTWDKAIETVEKLIENSKAQKKALTQQLLTGKRRLPGFTGAWREVKLKALAKILVSNVDKKTLPGEKPIRLCNYTDVYYNEYITDSLSFMKATAKAQEIEKFKLLPGDVIITKDSETPEDIAVPAVVSEALNGVICGYHLAIIRPQQELANGLFLSKLLSIPSVRHYFFSLANGATRFGLTTDAIVNAKLLVPTLPEQRRIGEVLQTLDRRIENQTKQRDALRQQKTALMQQLLTGKRRVKIDPEAG